jgi:anaerobic ribonucleoside-triphosphate reductase activating protein
MQTVLTTIDEAAGLDPITLRVHAQMESSSVNGPGQRAVIWVQGCSLACPSCWNPLSHSANGGRLVEIPVLLTWLKDLSVIGKISGLTMSGGEPLEQATALEALLRGVRASMPSLGIGLFSGYSEGELALGRCRDATLASPAARARNWQRIRGCLDFAVLGRYNRLQPSDRPLISSRNQQFLLFSDRHVPDDFANQSVEVTVGTDGLTQITGFATVA